MFNEKGVTGKASDIKNFGQTTQDPIVTKAIRLYALESYTCQDLIRACEFVAREKDEQFRNILDKVLNFVAREKDEQFRNILDKVLNDDFDMDIITKRDILKELEAGRR